MHPLTRLFFGSLAACLFTGAVSAQHFLLNQIGDTSGTVMHMPQSFFNQQATDVGGMPFSAAFIDDFTAQSYELRLTGVQAAVNAVSGNYGSITGWMVNIYSSAAAAATSLTGDVFSTTVGVGAVTLTSFNRIPSQNDFIASIPIDYTLSGAGTYWIGVMPVASTDDDNFYLNTSTLPGDLSAIQANPAGGFGFPGNQNMTNRNAALAVTAVPEPGTVLAGVGAVAALWCARRRRK